jgi:hypothetical protein
LSSVNAAACATAAPRPSAAPSGAACRRCGCRARSSACQPYAARNAAPASASDQRRVGRGAEQHHAADVLAAQALAQHKRVLRADGDDQAEAERQALDEDRDRRRGGAERGRHGASLPAAADEDKLLLLTLIKPN